MTTRILISIMVSLTLSGFNAAQEWPPEVQADYRAMIELGKKRDLIRMEAFIRDNMPRWDALGDPWWGHLILVGVQRLNSDNFEDREAAKSLKTELVRMALRNHHRLSLSDQVGLTQALPVRIRAANRPDRWLVQRREDAKAWLQTWKRLVEAIDLDWVAKPVQWNMAPNGMRSATQPEEIEDPKVRAEFEAALAKNERRAKRNLEQGRVRRLASTFFPSARRSLARMYAHPPRVMSELQALLLEFVEDREDRAEILAELNRVTRE